jgi:hypothetical protein
MRIRPAILLALATAAALRITAAQEAATVTPGPRANHGMTYDEHSGLVLMFGGMNAHARLGDFWAWDGRLWHMLSNGGPAPRDAAVLAYDSKRRRTILFGGRGTSESSPALVLDDTWEWDGVAWNEKPVSGPSMLRPIGAYDKRRERLVVYGGLAATGETRGQPAADTWEWDGERWSRRSNAGIEGVPNHMVYDERRKKVVIVQDSTMWCWDGLEWRRVTDRQDSPVFTAPKGMPDRSGYALAYDARRKRVVLFGGTGAQGRTGEMFGDTWEWTGTTWVRVDGR